MRELRRRHALALVDHSAARPRPSDNRRRRHPALPLGDSPRTRSPTKFDPKSQPLQGTQGQSQRYPEPRKRRTIRVFSFEQMHAFAEAAGRYEAMVRASSPTPARGWGRCLPLSTRSFRRRNTEVHRHRPRGRDPRRHQDRPRRARRGEGAVPVPATLRLDDRSPARKTRRTAISSSRARQDACGESKTSTATSGTRPRRPPGLDFRPHECRHSYVAHLRAAGINDADLAEIAGHRVETMLARFRARGGQFIGRDQKDDRLMSSA